MFNALNRFISRLDGDPHQQHQREREEYGFQVLRNTNLELAIEPWFDFIVGINGRMIVRDTPPQSRPTPARCPRHMRYPSANPKTPGPDRITRTPDSLRRRCATAPEGQCRWGYGAQRFVQATPAQL